MATWSTKYPLNISPFGTNRQEGFEKHVLEFTEVYNYLNLVRKAQAGTVAPTAPETNDLWLDTSGTAPILKYWSGSIWATISSPSVTNRNTVLQGTVDGSGNPTLIAGDASDLTADLVATTETIIAIPAGHDATVGNLDYIVSFSATQTDFWTSLPANNTSYLFVDYSSGTVTGTYSVIAPVYQSFAPAHASGKHWYDTNKEQWYLSSGSAWTAVYRCYVGSVVTDGTKVTAVSIYPYNVLRTNITGHASLDLALTGGTMSGLLNLAKGNNVASASTVNLSTATGNTVHITGTTGISAFTMTSGQVMDVIFDGALTLTHHTTNNNLPSAANITTVAGDRARYFYDGTTVYCLQYQRSNGTALVGGVLAGQVVQVQSVLKDTAFSGSSGSWTDITGLSVAITPSSTANKVLVTANVSARGGQQNVIARLMRDTTAIAVSTGQTNNATFQFNDSAESPTCSITFLDSPASTSAVTYKMQYKCPYGGSFHLNGFEGSGMVSGITVQEVKG